MALAVIAFALALEAKGDVVDAGTRHLQRLCHGLGRIAQAEGRKRWRKACGNRFVCDLLISRRRDQQHHLAFRRIAFRASGEIGQRSVPHLFVQLRQLACEHGLAGAEHMGEVGQGNDAGKPDLFTKFDIYALYVDVAAELQAQFGPPRQQQQD